MPLPQEKKIMIQLSALTLITQTLSVRRIADKKTVFSIQIQILKRNVFKIDFSGNIS